MYLLPSQALAPSTFPLFGCSIDPRFCSSSPARVGAVADTRSIERPRAPHRPRQATAKEQGTGEPAWKRTKAEALDEGIGNRASKIDDIDFSSSTEADRAMLIEAMNSLEDALNEAIPRAVQNQKKPV